MEVLKKMKPGEPGTIRYQQRFKDRLVCVRYRQDRLAGYRYTTVEVVVAKRPAPAGAAAWRKAGLVHPNRHVAVRVIWGEADLAARVRSAGGVWLAERKRWKMPLRTALELQLDDRIESLPENDDA